MICPLCKKEDIKIATELDDEGDIERTYCANKDCGFIFKEEVVTRNEDGTTRKRQRSIKEENQPDTVTGNSRRIIKPSSDILMSAEEMTALAMRTQEETVNKVSIGIVKLVLEACAQHVLNGQHTYLIKEDEAISGAVISQVVVELKEKGYKVKKLPVPGEGVNIQVKWPIKKSAPSMVKRNENLDDALQKSKKNRSSFKEKKSSLRKK